MYARKQWEAFAFVVSMHAVGVLWVFFRRDLTVTIGGLWLVLAVMLKRPKGAPVFVRAFPTQKTTYINLLHP